MKILFSVANTKVGGAQIVALRLAKQLSLTNNIEVFDCFPDERNQQILNAHFSDIKLISITENKLLRTAAWKINAILKRTGLFDSFFMWVTNLKLNRVIQKGHYNIVHSHMYFSDQIISCLRKKHNYGYTKFVLSMHGCYEERLKQKNQGTLIEMQEIIGQFDSIVYLTNQNIQFINQSDYKKILFKKIYNGIPIRKTNNSRSVRSDKGNQWVIGMVARGVKEKGWKISIQAFMAFRQKVFSNAKLILVGEGEYLNRLRAKYYNDKSIEFKGFVSDPIPIIMTFDIGLLPSESESLPTSLIEYTMAGVPSIATDTGDTKNIICQKGCECGILIPVRNKKESVTNLFNKIVELKNNTPLYKRLAQNTKKAILPFEIKHVVSEYESLYNKLIAH